ncbi:MAG: D-Ala-D-Ala carboxypeptidase family metallohydrolase, partial [Candidatus Firestonebacteria bacterium]
DMKRNVVIAVFCFIVFAVKFAIGCPVVSDWNISPSVQAVNKSVLIKFKVTPGASTQKINSWNMTEIKDGVNTGNVIASGGGAGINENITPSPSIKFEDAAVRKVFMSGTWEDTADPAGFTGATTSPEFTIYEVKITEVSGPNTGGSFTTNTGENQINCKADIKPDSLDSANNSNIVWVADDDPGDSINSGDPADPSNGNDVNFTATAPAAATGRGASLKYRVSASLTIGTSTSTATVTYISQDEIDQCRQEYMDMNKATKPGRTSFSTSGGSAHFTFEELSRYDDYVCAIITGGLTAGLEATRTNFGNRAMTVNSGYRNPIHNVSVGGVAERKHIYGHAADIAVGDFNGSGGDPDKADWDLLANAATAAGAVVEPWAQTGSWVHMQW